LLYPLSYEGMPGPRSGATILPGAARLARMTFTGFGPRALEVLRDIAAHNDRAWFAAHRDTYDEQVAGPLNELAAEVDGRLGEAKVHRPFRDVRFSKDKRPLKEQASMMVEPGTGRGYYLQLDVDGLFVAGGSWQPDREVLARFRALVDDGPAASGLQRVLKSLADKGFELSDHGRLTTAPRGFPRDHPRIDLLRQGSLAVGHDHEAGDWLFDERCRDVVLDGWDVVRRWNRWLDTHLG
jgi:uncharacterized protein (TIGR02453 family)